MAAVWLTCGSAFALVTTSILLRALGEHPNDFPLWGLPKAFWLVGILMAGGAAYMVLPWCLPRLPFRASSFVGIVLTGLLLRGILFESAPLFEIDYYRYLWDGAAAAHGLNPYAVPPAAVLSGDAPSAWLALAEHGRGVVDRINYPEIRTIYPPVAQAVFALAHWLAPWSLAGLRAVLLVFDLVTFVLLILLLRHVGRSPLWSALYWWNPLFIKETVNSAHMDVILLPFLLAGLLCALRLRPLIGTSFLSLAAGVKLWPVLLLPLLWRPLTAHPGRLAGALAVAAVLGLLLAFPMVWPGLTSNAGVLAYAQGWEFNGAIFSLLRDAGAHLLGTVEGAGGQVARVLVALAVIGTAVALSRRRPVGPVDAVQRALILIAVIFFLSPTGYPWYFAWMLPLLTVLPVYGLLALTVALPLYYLRFHFGPRGEIEIFETYVVWLEFGPILLLLAWSAISRRRTAPPHPAGAKA